MARALRVATGRRFIAGASIATTLGMALLMVAPAVPATAAAPDIQGWWTSSNPGGLPVNPAPPDVPADGLLVQGGPQAPTAYAALSYAGITADAAPVVTATLTLNVAPNTVTAPSATLRVCPLTASSFTAAQGGPIADAPPYDCAHPVDAMPDAAGTAYVFAVGSLISDGNLKVAVVPVDPVTRIVLAKADTNSLTAAPAAVARAAPPSSEAPTSPSNATAASSAPPAAAPIAPPAPTGGEPAIVVPALPPGQVAAPASAAPAPVVAGTPSTNVETAPAAFAAASSPVASGSASSDVLARVLGGAVLAATTLAAALWAFAGGGAPDQRAAPQQD